MGKAIHAQPGARNVQDGDYLMLQRQALRSSATRSQHKRSRTPIGFAESEEASTIKLIYPARVVVETYCWVHGEGPTRPVNRR